MLQNYYTFMCHTCKHCGSCPRHVYLQFPLHEHPKRFKRVAFNEAGGHHYVQLDVNCCTCTTTSRIRQTLTSKSFYKFRQWAFLNRFRINDVELEKQLLFPPLVIIVTSCLMCLKLHSTSGKSLRGSNGKIHKWWVWLGLKKKINK